MCGIFGAITEDSNAAQMVFDGLKDIEYRGYDLGGWRF
jgi:glucosamine 6-phosphate synthetase-like amidotransferase/phosphosugar isomerase protein